MPSLLRRRARGLILAVLAIGCLTICAPAAADPTPDEIAGARAAATQANAAFAKKNYADALDLFKRAESLVHASTHQLMIARSEVALGKLVSGRETYRALVHETLSPKAPQAFRDAQASAKKELEALEPRVPTILAKVDDPTAKNVIISMDGVEIPKALAGVARPVDPGDHVFTARGDVVAADEKSVRVEEGAHIEFVLKLHPADPLPGTVPAEVPKPVAPPPEPADPTLGIVGYTALAVGGAGVIVGGVFMGLGFAKRGEADDAYAACGSASCVSGSAQANEIIDLDDTASLNQTVGLISLIAGGAIAGTGLVLVLVAPSDPEPSDEAPQATITPFIGPGFGGFRGTF